DVATDLDLPVRPALIDGLAAERADLLVGVAEPPGRRRVRGEAVAAHLVLALAFGRLKALEDRERFVRRDRVGDVAEVDAADHVRRAHVGEQLPDGLALRLCPEVPYRVHDGGGREMHRALVWADPPQLRIAGDLAPEMPHILRDRLERLADDERPQRVRGGEDDLVAASGREREAVPG